MEAAVHKVSGAEARTLDVSCFSTFTVKWLIPRLYGFMRNTRASTSGYPPPTMPRAPTPTATTWPSR
jgi:hypothetical protein